MDKLNLVLKALFQSVRVSVETFTLPTGQHLIPAFLISLSIFVVTLVCKLFGLFTVIQWPGALLGTLVLLGIIIVERSERSEVSNFYRVVAKGVNHITNRKTHSTSYEPAQITENHTELCPERSDRVEGTGDSETVCSTHAVSGGPVGGSIGNDAEDSDDPDLD